jgi:hypothetical protein
LGLIFPTILLTNPEKGSGIYHRGKILRPNWNLRRKMEIRLSSVIFGFLSLSLSAHICVTTSTMPTATFTFSSGFSLLHATPAHQTGNLRLKN